MEQIAIDAEIRLESIQLSMAEMIFNTIDRDREYLKKWLPFVNQTKRQVDTEFFIRGILQSEATGRNKVYAIWYQNRFAGLISLKETDYINLRTEIGYWLSKDMQGKGIAIRAVRKLTEYAFNELNLNRIQIRIAVGNSRSAAIPRKLGFQFEGIERDGEFHTSHFFDIEVYSLLKKDLIGAD